MLSLGIETNPTFRSIAKLNKANMYPNPNRAINETWTLLALDDPDNKDMAAIFAVKGQG
jgi:hypothetical protein